MRCPWSAAEKGWVRLELVHDGPGVEERCQRMRSSIVGANGVLLLLTAPAVATARMLRTALSTLATTLSTLATIVTTLAATGQRTWGGVGSSDEIGWRRWCSITEEGGQVALQNEQGRHSTMHVEPLEHEHGAEKEGDKPTDSRTFKWISRAEHGQGAVEGNRMPEGRKRGAEEVEDMDVEEVSKVKKNKVEATNNTNNPIKAGLAD